MKLLKNYRFSGFLFGLLFISTACYKNEEAGSLPGTAEYEFKDDENSLLWEISGKGLKQPSYLYGTIHIMRKEVFAYDNVVKAIFDSCRAYAMELNMADIKLEEMNKMMKLDRPLDSILPPVKYHQLDSLLKAKSGLPLSQMKMIKPFFIMALMMKKEIGGDMETALDLDFYDKAQKAGKKLIGIEKFEEQMAAVDALTIEQQADLMIKGYLDTTSSMSKFEEMLESYLKQDLPAIMKMMLEDESYPPEFNEAFIIKRNKKMADRIGEISAKRMTFNAIGAAHLPGKDGVIQLLRNNGYTVKPIKFTFKKTKKEKK
ncbi:MAG: TraB/GumN family protein [Flavobacteriales bacterium]